MAEFHIQSIHAGEQLLVNDIRLSFKQGECLALVGESGSGKSLSALAMMNLLPNSLTTKAAFVHSVQPSAAMVFQEPMSALNPSMRVGRQVAEAAEASLGLSRKAANEKALTWFKHTQIADPEQSFKKYPHQMSGGQRQRVMIAMAMVMDPDIVIADEPTTALGASVAADILSLIRQLQKQEGMAMLLISHDLSEVSRVADHVMVMRQGQLMESGPTQQVLNHPTSPYTQGLIASRPPEGRRPKRLPTVEDFMQNRPVDDSERSASQSGPVLLEIRDLSKAYAGQSVVKDLSLVIHEGETLGLVGASGSGKSTIAKCLVNLVQPDAGEIRYRGERIDQLHGAKRQALARDIQYIFQDPFASLSPRMTIGDAITEPMVVHGLHSNSVGRKQAMEDLLKSVGFEALDASKYPHEFSGGQRQRIGIARALAVEPRLIICDESVAALDVSIQAQVLNLLNDLKEQHSFSYLFISHDELVVDYMSDAVLVLD